MPRRPCRLGSHDEPVAFLSESATQDAYNRVVHAGCLINYYHQVTVVLSGNSFRITAARRFGNDIPGILEAGGVVSPCFLDERARHPWMHPVHVFLHLIKVLPDNGSHLFNIVCR